MIYKEFSHYTDKKFVVGVVDSLARDIFYVTGLDDLRINNVVVFENNSLGLVIGLSLEGAKVLLFKGDSIPTIGMKVVSTKEPLKVSVGKSLLGNVINPLGEVILNKPSVLTHKETVEVFKESNPSLNRVKISKPLHTGLAKVDLMVPLGVGQRELLIGDKKTGKTSFALQAVAAQASQGTVCIYVCISKKKNDILRIYDYVDAEVGLSEVLIIASEYSENLGSKYISPYTAMSYAEYFRDLGKDVLIIFDDMSNHAAVHREISLLDKKFPGRQSYPGNIFYIHARLLERAGNFTNGAITCLPIATTIEGELSGYIPTNLMSMTDGHLFFDKNIFYSGHRPAINHNLSVTRVGRQTQSGLRWAINRELLAFYALFSKTENFINFGAEVNETIKTTLNLGDKLNTFFTQDTSNLFSIDLQIYLFCIIWSRIKSNVSSTEFKDYITDAINDYKKNKKVQNEFQALIKESVDLNALLGKFMQFSIKYKLTE